MFLIIDTYRNRHL